MTSDDTPPAGVVRVRARNASPFTLDGTNTYVVSGWVVDPGPADEEHLAAVADAAGGAARIDGIVLTHDHRDHAEGAPRLSELADGAPVVLPRGDGEVGPFWAIATPGHAPDHVALILGRVCFTGDTVLGAGSVFISGSLDAYLASLRRLRELDLECICPGHGPFVHDPAAKLDEYIAHRLERERKVLAALEAGARTPDELLDAAWDEIDWTVAPPGLREAARVTLEAHLEKLREEGRAA